MALFIPLFCTLYILPCMYNLCWMYVAYSKKGIFYGDKTTKATDYALVFIPILNIIVFLSILQDNPYKHRL